MMLSKFKLKNGIEVLTIPYRGTSAATVLVLVKVGSRYEQHKTLGLSHYLEHMMFKGTERRPNTLDIAKELDGVGAEYNAFTAKDHTGYYVKTAAEHIPRALDVVSDILFHSLLKEEEINRERSVIVEELNMYEDNPMMIAEEIFEELLFSGNSLGWRIGGTKETVAHVRRKDIVAHWKQWYTPTNIVVVLAGRYAPSDILKLKERFGSHERSEKSRLHHGRWKPWVRPKLVKPEVALKFKETEQAQIVMGVPAFRLKDKRNPALAVLSTLWGGTMSSRLFSQVRERRGLAYFIRSAGAAYEDAGALTVQAGLQRERLDEAISVIRQEMKNLWEDAVSDDEVKRSQEHIAGKIALDFEDSETIAAWYGRQYLLTGQLKSPQQKLREIRAVRPPHVVALAKQLFSRVPLRLIVIGPYRNPEHFQRLLR
jgi:predicted Zn-dependent peptidase